ncbi:MAG: LppA family lipoprotein [Mycobacterium sp.]
MLIGGCSVSQNPHESDTIKGDEAIMAIDALRPKGSFEDARRRLDATAERVVAAVPGQTWQFNPNPHGRNINRQGLPCKGLTGDIARRPRADSVQFGRRFSAEEFAIAIDIVRREAGQYGASEESSLFNEQDRRDFNVEGNGYEFNLGQLDVATLTITGGCFLMQSVVNLPPGQLPPEPPIVPVSPTPPP